MTPTTASWQHRLRHALAAHALIEAGDRARGTTSSSAALLAAVRAVQNAIAQAEADGATEHELDEVIAGRAPTASEDLDSPADVRHEQAPGGAR